MVCYAITEGVLHQVFIGRIKDIFSVSLIVKSGFGNPSCMYTFAEVDFSPAFVNVVYSLTLAQCEVISSHLHKDYKK